MKKIRSIALAAALVAGLLTQAGCSKIPIAEPALEGPYGKELGGDTRRASIYQGLETRLFVHIVWLKPELIAAQAALVSEMRAEPPDLAAVRLKKMQDDNATPTFFAIAYTPTPSWNDWDSKNSVWRIAMDGPQGQVAPAKITRYDGPFNAEMLQLYPYLDEFVSAYRIEFPQSAMGTDPKILLAGVLGKVELDWSKPE